MFAVCHFMEGDPTNWATRRRGLEQEEVANFHYYFLPEGRGKGAGAEARKHASTHGPDSQRKL